MIPRNCLYLIKSASDQNFIVKKKQKAKDCGNNETERMTIDDNPSKQHPHSSIHQPSPQPLLLTPSPSTHSQIPSFVFLLFHDGSQYSYEIYDMIIEKSYHALP